MMKRVLLPLLLLGSLIAACSDDDTFSTDRSNRLTFSTDTVKMDTVFSTVGSSTYTFWVFNNSADGIRLTTVKLKNGNQTGFRANVDGSYLDNTMGSVVSDLEVRKGDSIRVFVELTAPENKQLEPQQLEDALVFTLESGVEQRVVLRAHSWDAIPVRGLTIAADTLIESARPIVVYGDGIKVDSGAVLTIRNTTLYFHDGAGLNVGGSLVTENVVMRGDRLDHMFDYLPYDRVSGQWKGVTFSRSSHNNLMTDTEIRNAMTAVLLEDSARLDSVTQRLTMTRCLVHNAKGDGVVAYNSNIGLYNCQLTNTLGDCLAVYGGIADIDQCTMAQFYPFSANRGVALRFTNYADLVLLCTNSIFTGYEDDEIMGEANDSTKAFQYLFYNCLMRTPEVEDDTVSFKQILWETPKDSIQGKKHFVKIDEENLDYDFHLDSLSTAQGMGCY